MSAATITTITKMIESLPDDLQERIAEHLREYIADLEEETKWNDSFQKTQHKLVEMARKAKQEIANGKAIPMDYDQL